MKTFFYTLLFVCSFTFCTAQTGTWLDGWNKLTVSIGKIDTLKIINNGVLKFQPFFDVVGTGVIFYVKYENSLVIPCIVTAKHVFQDSSKNWNPKSLRIRYSEFEDKSVVEYFGIEVKLSDKKQNNWYSHPDFNVDLACLPLKPKDRPEDIKIMPYTTISNDTQLYLGASILVYGYPGAIGLEYLHRPLLRNGIIAWLPSNQSKDSKILIDCEIFPGNSGGPVFFSPIGLSRDGGLELGGKTSFIGIVTQRRFSGTDVYYFEKDRQLIPVIDSIGNKFIALESIGIGVVEPASKVRELLKYVEKELNK